MSMPAVQRDKIESSLARRAAEEVTELMRPVSESIEVMGSLRRGAMFVGDVELLIVPKLGQVVVEVGLFEEIQIGNLQLDLVNKLVAKGVLEDRLDVHGRHARGERLQRLIYRGVKVDLFCCLPPAQKGVLQFIRTGPTEWTRPIITPRCKGGKTLPEGMYLRDGALFKHGELVSTLDMATGLKTSTYQGGELVLTPDEHSFFGAIGLDYVPPEERR